MRKYLIQIMEFFGTGLDKMYQTILELPTPHYLCGEGWFLGKARLLLTDLYERALMCSQYFPSYRIRAIQEKRLERILRHAQKSIPFYATHLGKEEWPKLSLLPPITKTEMRKAYDAGTCISPELLRFGHSQHTSGSTGVPFYFFFDKSAIPRGRARYRRMIEWAEQSKPNLAVRLIPGEYIWIAGEGLFLQCFDPNDVEKHLDTLIKLSKKSPLVLQSRTSHLVKLAQLFESRSLKIPLQALISYTEQLYSPTRSYLERTLGAPVFNFYACNEITAIGFECCEHNGFHVLSELVYVEIFNDGKPITEPNVPGDIVVTSLDNFVMPFIRYKIGDRGWWLSESCPCGRTLPRIQVEGRDINAFMLSNGRVGHLGTLVWPISLLTSKITRYQIFRHTSLRFEVKIVPTATFQESDTRFIIQKMREYLGKETEVSVAFVSEIERTPGGKIYAFVNKAPDFGPLQDK